MLNFFVFEFTTDSALDAVNSVFWVSDALTLGNFTNEALAFFGDSDYGWGSAVAFGVSNNFRFACYHVSESAVGGTKVNSDHF